MQVQDIDVDIYNHEHICNWDETEIYVRHQYVDSKHFDVLISCNKKLPKEIQIMIYYRKYKMGQLIYVDIAEHQPSLIRERVEVLDEIEIEPGNLPIIVYPDYNLCPCPSTIEKSSLEEFNRRFSDVTEIYHPLPTNIYAVGIQDNIIYMYNEAFSSYYEIIAVIQFQIRVFLTFFSSTTAFAFLICADDGYMEGFYSNTFDKEKRSQDKIEDFSRNRSCRRIPGDALQENEYAVLHRAKWILAMSNKMDVPYTIDVIDRHYFYCSHYHHFRSFHGGVSFQHKISKIVYGGRIHNSSKYNFLHKLDLPENMTQREYFYSDAVSKKYVVAERGKWIESKEMAEYKYILDMDGNGCTWDATAWKLNSGSIIMKVESAWRQWFYDDYRPWVHYVPIADDFSDLQEKYYWCESHPEECEKIISNAKDLFQEVYRFANVVDYTRRALQKIM
jgi:hypothetical protein